MTHVLGSRLLDFKTLNLFIRLKKSHVERNHKSIPHVGLEHANRVARGYTQPRAGKQCPLLEFPFDMDSIVLCQGGY